MKFSIVLADDEPLALKSEEMFIRREFPEIDIVGLAGNGIELKKMLENLHPDMAIVDIRMPGLTGLEVIELVQNHGSKTKFIINTAYDDFEYVKTALDLRTYAFLLKPFKKDEAISVISKLLRETEEERKKEIRDREIINAVTAINPTLETSILASIISGMPDVDEWKTYTAINNMTFSAGVIVSFLPIIRLDGVDCNILKSSLVNVLRNSCRFLLTIYSENIVMLLFVPKEVMMDSDAWVMEMTAIINTELESLAGTEYLYGVGNIKSDFSKLYESYKESQLSIRKRMGTGTLQISTDGVEEYIRRVKSYVKKYYSKDISLEECSEFVGISPFYLSRLFKEQTGKNFSEYLSEIRIDKAKELLTDKNIALKDIGIMCGYSNISYFYKVFKKSTGKTVGEYRKEICNV